MIPATIAPRRVTPSVRVGPLTIGSAHPIAVQAMTCTPTADLQATAAQAAALARAGAELVRVTVNDEDAARAVPALRARLDDEGLAVPLVGDFHFNGHRLLRQVPELASALAKLRINPGNVGAGARGDERFRELVAVALAHDLALRIGVNWGSLDRQVLAELLDENARRSAPLPLRAVQIDALVASALRSAEAAEAQGLGRDRLVLSVKVSSPVDLWAAYGQLAQRTDCALHLGLTEAGPGDAGIVASTAALAPLLAAGLGDTIRVSLTPRPGEPRTREVEVAQAILQSLGLRAFAPTITACPGCGRTASARFSQLAAEIEGRVRAHLPAWRREHPGVEALRVAVMGCVVNGPGEAAHADIGISLPGAGEQPRAAVFVEGREVALLDGEDLAGQFFALLEDYVRRRFGG